MPVGQNVEAPRRPEEHTLTDDIDIHDDGPMIAATVFLPNCTPARALSAFTDPEQLKHWWRGELTAELRPGGGYTVEFATIGARLTGQIVRFEPARSLEFSWSWNDDPPDSTVLVTAEPGREPNSVLLVLKHGPHQDDAVGRSAHQEHWEGWEYFLPRLVNELRAQDGGMLP